MVMINESASKGGRFRPLTRRGFLGAMGLGCASLFVACGSASTPTAPTAAPSAAATPTAVPTTAPDSAGAPATATAPTKPAASNITLIASSDSRAVYEAAAKDLQDTTGAGVNLVTQAYDQTHDKIVSSVAGGGDVDVVAVDTIWTAEFAAAGFIDPLDDRITPDLKSQIVQAALVGRSYKENTYQWPLFTLKFLYYNDELVRKSGITDLPTTLEDLVVVGKAVQEKAGVNYAMGWAMAQAEGLTCDYVMLLKAFGGQYTDDNGNWVINDGGGLKALEYMVDSLYTSKFADPASLTLTDRTVRNPFNNGDYPFIFNWTSAWVQAKDPANSKIVDSVRLGLVPGSREAGVVSASVTGGSGFGLVSRGKQKDLAWQYIELVAITEDAQRRLLKMVNQVPNFKSLYDDPQIKQEYPQFEVMRKQMDYGIARPELPWYAEWSKILQIEVTNALSQNKTPKQALDDAVKAMNERAKQYA